MQLDDWFEHARRDAVRRGLPDLEPLLDMLFEATRALRAADWARTGDLGTTCGDTGAGDDGTPGNHEAAGDRQATGLDADASSDPTGARRATPGNGR